MVHKLQTLLLMTVLLSYSIIVVASDFDDGTLEYTITSPANLEVQCSGFTDAHENDESVIIPSTVNYNNRTYTVTSVAYSYSYAHPNTTLKKITLPSTLKKHPGLCISVLHVSNRYFHTRRCGNHWRKGLFMLLKFVEHRNSRIS